MSEELAINGGPVTRDKSAKPWPTNSNASGHMFGDEELALLAQVIESGQLGWQYGTMVKQFEAEFAARHGAKHACAVTSGTAALHTAMGALRLEVGDEVITSAVTDMGTVIAIVQCNCVPVFADVDPQTMLMTPESIESLITDRTRAIVCVHLFGQPCEMDAIVAQCEQHDLALVEDCAQAHDAAWDGRPVGTIGDIGCFSLQQSKHITTGDGGICITDDDEFQDHMVCFHDKYYDRTGQDRAPQRIGINYRMSELVGAVALAQVRKLDTIIGRRQQNADIMCAGLAEIEGLNPPKVHPKVTQHTWWRLAFTIDEEILGVDSQKFGQSIGAEGLPFSVAYGRREPICMLPALANYAAYGSGNFPWEPPYGRAVPYRREDYPGTNWAMSNVFGTSWIETLTEDDVNDMLDGLRKVADYYRERA